MDATEILDDAEAALESGESARVVARRYVDRADRAGALRPFVSLLREWDPGMADDVLLDFVLRERRNGGPVGSSGLVRLADVEAEDVAWLWPGRVPLGKLTMVEGDPGVGKSTLALDLAARLSVGAPMPDGAAPEVDGPRGTVLLTAEDGLGDTVRPRLDAAGGDPDRVARLATVPGEDGPRIPTVEDVGAIRRAVDEMDAALVVVDPLTAFVGHGVNAHRDADIRRALAPLADLADDARAAVVAIRHLNKSGSSNPLYRGGGSIAFIAAARSGLLAARDPADPDGPCGVLAATKANLAPRPPALAYRLEAAENDHPRVQWEGETDHRAADLLDRPDPDERTARDEAAAFLRVELSRGPRPVTELKAAAKDAGLSWRTVERAKKEMGVEARKRGFAGPWCWELPDDASSEPARGTSVRDVAAFDDEDAEDPGASGPESKTANPDASVADFAAENGGVADFDDDPPADPSACPECGRPIGPTSSLCGRCKGDRRRKEDNAT